LRQLNLFDAIEIPLTKGFVALVDPVDSDLAVLNWHANPKGYAEKYDPVSRGKMHLHRIMLSRKIGGALLPDELVDHINGNRCDNRRSNLRIATAAQNLRNVKRHADNQSGYKGVTWNTRQEMWLARICVDYKSIHLGYFHDPLDAALAYDEAARRYFDTFARCNFPAPGGDE